jgi:hypothetical protein
MATQFPSQTTLASHLHLLEPLPELGSALVSALELS